MTQTSQRTEDLFTALADGQPTSPGETPGDPKAESIRLLTDVRNVFREQLQARQPPDTSAPQFTWGELRVFEALGQGGYGKVYRAHDPWLARDVALKLFATDVGGGSQLIEEARLLGGLRHPNVLLIHGAAVHAGRAGYWSEWVRGQTLAHLIERDGAFSIEESLRVARDLASALNAVHRIGLVHADVKAENVMRESGGRVVLMDFGASGSVGSLAARLLVSGTPRYLAPEVLSGEPIGASSDWYAFGVLLYLMLAGEFPFPSMPYDALCEAKRLPPPSLLTKRSDLPASMAIWVDSLIAVQPGQRPNPNDIARFLTASRGQYDNDRVNDAVRDPETPKKTSSSQMLNRRAWLGLAIAASFAVAAIAAWFGMRAPPWDASAEFLRVSGGGDELLAADAELALKDRFYLRMHSNRPSFVYVLNEDADGIATVLFPTAEDANPVPAGVDLRLPGNAQSGLAWQVTTDSDHEEFVVISAIQALPALEQELSEWRRAEQSSTVRSTGAIVDAGNAMISGERLRAAVAEARAQAPGDARIWQFHFSASPDISY
jgi:eukaryotic-like serine/threonine-protein kinase